MLGKGLKGASVPCSIASILTIIVGYNTVAGLQPLLLPVFLVIAVAWKYVLSKIEAKNSKINNQNL